MIKETVTDKPIINKKHKPEFWYEWGTEKAGYVSTGCYIDGVYVSTGQRKREDVKYLPFNNPHA